MTRAVIRQTQDWANEESEDPAILEFSRRFESPSKPQGRLPDLPYNLDELSDANLMGLYAEFMAWLSYSKSELVQAEIKEERQENNCRIIEAEVLIGQWSDSAKGDTVTLAKARRDTDHRVIEQREKHLHARAYRKLVEAVFDRCERSAQLMSRELSRRIGLSPKEVRNARYMP